MYAPVVGRYQEYPIDQSLLLSTTRANGMARLIATNTIMKVMEK